MYCIVLLFVELKVMEGVVGTCKCNSVNVLLFVHCFHAMSDAGLTVVDNCY